MSFVVKNLVSRDWVDNKKRKIKQTRHVVIHTHDVRGTLEPCTIWISVFLAEQYAGGGISL